MEVLGEGRQGSSEKYVSETLERWAEQWVNEDQKTGSRGQG